jgi:hypothetical protein
MTDPIPLRVIDLTSSRRTYPGDMWQTDEGWVIILPNLMSWATFPRGGKPYRWTVTGTPPAITVHPSIDDRTPGFEWYGWISRGMLIEAA